MQSSTICKKSNPWEIWGATRCSCGGDDRSDTTTKWGIRYIQGTIVGDAWAVMRWFAAGWVLEEGASKARSDMTAPRESREGLSKHSPAGPFFLALLWLTRTMGSLRFWPSNSHHECFPVATSTGDTVRGETRGYFLYKRW